MGVKGTKRISPELSEKIFQVSNREEVKGLTNKQIAEIVNKEYLEETGNAVDVKENNVRSHSGVSRGSGYHRQGNVVHSMDDVKSTLRERGSSLEGTDQEIRNRARGVRAAVNRSERGEIGRFLSDRARNSKIPDVKSSAIRLFDQYQNDKSFPSTKKHFDEINSLRRGRGNWTSEIRPPGTSRGRTFRETELAGPVPDEIKQFTKHGDIINDRANMLARLKIITPEVRDSLKISGGHGFSKSDLLWPQLRNSPPNVYLQSLSENLEAGSRATAKDIYEYTRMNERMPGVGTDKTSLRNMYIVNNILRANNLEPIPEETVKYFRGLPSIRSWKPNVGKNIVSGVGTTSGDVSGVIKRSLMNLLGSRAGKRVLKSGRYALPAGILGLAAGTTQASDLPWLAADFATGLDTRDFLKGWRENYDATQRAQGQETLSEGLSRAGQDWRELGEGILNIPERARNLYGRARSIFD
mgnify:CR=1 FL=1